MQLKCFVSRTVHLFATEDNARAHVYLQQQTLILSGTSCEVCADQQNDIELP